jgi:hypothetical protein
LPAWRWSEPIWRLTSRIRSATRSKILLGGFQFAQGLLFLRLEFGDARRLLENHAAVFRLAGKDLRDVPLRHDAVTGAAHAGAHEKLLDVLEPAGRLVEKIFADPSRKTRRVR